MGDIPVWVARADKVFNVSNRYASALKSAFIRFQTPPPDAALPPEHLLAALQLLVQRITDELDGKAGKLCLRAISQDDIDALRRSDPTVDIEQALRIEQFDEIARKVLKRVALDRGRRLGIFMVGGILVVHLFKGTISKLPFIGPTVGAVVSALMPTTVLGPAVGIAGAMYM